MMLLHDGWLLRKLLLKTWIFSFDQGLEEESLPSIPALGPVDPAGLHNLVRFGEVSDLGLFVTLLVGCSFLLP
jgi:hypothetical protein